MSNLTENYHNDHEKYGLNSIIFDEPDLVYEWNTLGFWATKDGRIYSKSDNGCSCNCFSDGLDFNNNEQLEVLFQSLERVGSTEQAIAIYNSCDKDVYNSFIGISGEKELVEWLSKYATTFNK